MPANPDKETPLALQVVYYKNPVLKGKQPIWCPKYSTEVWKILEVLHFSENCLSTKTLEGSQTILTENTTTMAQRFPRAPTYDPSKWKVTTDKNREENTSE